MANTCPIWGTWAIIEGPKVWERRVFVNSPRAGGWYDITEEAIQDLGIYRWDASKKVLLTSWLVEQRRIGIERPQIYSKDWDKNWDEIKKNKTLSIDDRADNLLRFLASKSTLLGQQIQIDFLSSGLKASKLSEGEQTALELLAWTGSTGPQDISEVMELIKYCEEKNWIDHPIPIEDGCVLKLEIAGRKRIEGLDGV